MSVLRIDLFVYHHRFRLSDSLCEYNNILAYFVQVGLLDIAKARPQILIYELTRATEHDKLCEASNKLQAQAKYIERLYHALHHLAAATTGTVHSKKNRPFQETNKKSATTRDGRSVNLRQGQSSNGMLLYHHFNHHSESVTAIKFARGEKYRLACSSTDGTLSVCVLVPSPASVSCTLRGHTAAVTDFEWTMNNDMIASSSLDRTTRVWNPESGFCLRVLNDNQSSGVMACRFQPLDNNMLLGGSAKMSAGAKSMEFNPSGAVVWVGDEKGFIYSFGFHVESGRLVEAKWVIDNEGGLKLRNSFSIGHKSYDIRSSFCPVTSSMHGYASFVSGSEDMAVYFFTFENAETPRVTKLFGHSAPVLDVCWNYDETLMASCDVKKLTKVKWTGFYCFAIESLFYSSKQDPVAEND
ncbi:hypothetical protein ACROYT_G038089 [Oculina patagonica]